MEEINAKVVTKVPGPKSRELLKKREKYVAKGVSCSYPVFVEEAKGALVKDIDGNVFVDFAGGIGVQNIGHRDDGVVEAVKEQLDKYIHACFHVNMYEPYVDLAEKLTEITPGNFAKKAMFANSGAEAVENAIKIARAYTKKSGIISMNGSFHGRTNMTMSITSKYKPYKNGFGPFVCETYKADYAYCYRCPLGCKFKDCGIACAEKLKTMLKTVVSPDMIACLIVEPVQGEGGFVVPPKDYFKALQQICNENNIVFIVDEVQAGFARTGKFFAHEYFDVDADIITMSKSIANGLPISAVVGKAEIMDAACVGGIGGTYGGNPLSCVAAIKVIDKIKEANLNEKSIELGKSIMNRLNEMKEKYNVIGDVRGLGAMIGVEFVKDKDTKEPNKEIVSSILDYCFKHGVIFLNAGLLGNVLRFLPPVVMTDEQLKYGLDTLEEAIRIAI
ncbi:4-aminobutyrate aminotransferase/(S)-3-amino-2-methylpropionate transaminase [Clostridium acetobutylicum]|uniref:(S)-3-amino-2-methylpropionate transaminase n=1 Tax=Clostridium acetobutylicum (strain ATCC 824 / DSM 792 / JCM 1419 / IAM 19013 / LMG 5710 / NBRC 13948 / NRRL B-527 / VKM B-1787 / 2291 / W) TaxID=272562 RepID=Q97J59_CLOAB|nr:MULTISPECIES: 4-aminobutyrate--2-oxoglutarate transaminase [Clostridium]AAK79395.1 4-aminobutyrate aminotransferase (PLP-dependent) [Clostridium acetobutylicum ATCC 824]ADZ20480.1 4-aminobutyrate aminotransferase (PLP-dependent) [Clostridium acetobutylicum EA 2018]AEI34611.1 4-aminobutyrate aminotransferase [Clostridium acetobutylicum DSM 1731]AWV81356.1 4-aminobutyrate--2-oxoglutarate transaminase [Clostridium acetobutylicum]MBC2392990.1 4-aminobutyrate--2-oxoglutarate transaminase [Clostr